MSITTAPTCEPVNKVLDLMVASTYKVGGQCTCGRTRQGWGGRVRVDSDG